MNILAIETSCDDTGAAVVKKTASGIVLLSNVVSSQIKIHQPFGGVVPNLAAREHLKNIKPCLKTALKEASNLDNSGIDLIAVTQGPGLIPSLQIGVNFAKTLAYNWRKPIIGINHLEGHIYANWLSCQPRDCHDPILPKAKSGLAMTSKIVFPALCLVISGGHTQLILMENHGKYELLGQTRDDAAGEAFDKVAKLLGLGYPGGPILSARAQKGEKTINLPRPMIYEKNFDFSFSGLKTAVLYEIKGKKLTKQYINDVAASFQQAVIDVLVHKTNQAAKKYRPRTILLAGGVAANEELRKQIKEQLANVLLPEIKFCGDNAAMIAAAACFRKKKNQHWSKLNADSNLKL